MLDLSARKVYGALAEQCVGGDAKADKVENATSGNLAGLDANGNLTDSGVSPTEDVTVEGNPVTFESPFEQDAKSVVVSVKPIQAGSGTPSPDNIRPISGIDEVEIGVVGKNKWDDPTYTETKTGQGFYVGAIATPKPLNRMLPAGKYVISFDWQGGTYPSDAFAFKYYNDSYGSSDYVVGTNSRTVIPFTAVRPFNGITLWGAYGGTISNIQIEEGTEATPYEPYKGSTTTIPLPSTLYGGTVDVDTGVVTVTDGYIASYDGETLPGEWISDRDEYVAGTSPTTGAEVAYKLATPTTLSLTPAILELLEGTNVVSTNAEKVAVTYGRSLWQDINDLKTDTEGKLNKSDVADVEGDTASRPYAVNEFMLRSDGFYKVTQPIAQNASITSSNTTKTTIGAVLTALLNA